MEVLVIGGGIIGVCSAYYLAHKGHKVTLVEKGRISAGCSYGNAGLIVPSHSIPLAAPGVPIKALKWMLNPESPFYVKARLSWDLCAWLWRFTAASTRQRAIRAIPIIRDLSYASLALYKELAKLDGPDFSFRQDGTLLVFRTGQGYRSALKEINLLDRSGLKTQTLNGSSAHEIEPSLLADIAGAILFPDDAHLVPSVFVTGIASVAQQMGVRVETETEVLGFRKAGRRIIEVETTKGVFRTDLVVLAAGAWTPQLVKSLGLRLPIEAAKGYSLTYERLDFPRLPLLLGEAKVAVTPMANWLRLAGTLELAGLDLSVNQRRVRAIVTAVRRYIAGIDSLKIVEVWRGLRPCTPDGLPIVGWIERLENLMVAAGHGMIGISLGPITGKLVSQLASQEQPQVDVAPLAPSRFA